MRENGYYWAQFVQFGGIDLVMWQENALHSHQDITDAELRIICGPWQRQVSRRRTRRGTLPNSERRLAV